MKKLLSISFLLLGQIFIVPNALSVTLGNEAPNFTLKSNSGKNLRLSEQRGDVVLINFWASWCGPCRQEMPELEAIYKKYQSLGFTIYGINIDKERESADKVLNSEKLTFPILFDTENTISELYQVDAMPSTVIVDRSGTVRFLHRGYKPGYEDEYIKQIKSLLME
jgi:peroxiredoxin